MKIRSVVIKILRELLLGVCQSQDFAEAEATSPKLKLWLILQFLVGSKKVIIYLKFKLDKTNCA